MRTLRLPACLAMLAAAVPPNIIEELARTKSLAEVGPQVAGRPALIVRGRFADYNPGGSAVRAIYGKNPTLTAEVELVDADTGRSLGETRASGIVKSVVRASPTGMASGVGKGVKKFILAHMKRRAAKEEED